MAYTTSGRGGAGAGLLCQKTMLAGYRLKVHMRFGEVMNWRMSVAITDERHVREPCPSKVTTPERSCSRDDQEFTRY